MASVRLKASSKNWFACITMPDGKQRQFSTGTDVKEEAYAMAIATERALRKPKASQVRAALLRLADDYEPEVSFSAAQWFRLWAKSRDGTVASRSHEAYRVNTTRFADWLEANGILDLSGITTDVLTRYRDTLTKSASSKNTCIKILSVALNAAVKAGHMPSNPALAVQRLRQSAPIRREFRAKELKILLSTVTEEWKCLTLLGLYTGQRLNDLAELRWSNIDLTTSTILLHSGKTGRLIHLPLLPPVLDAISELPAGEKPEAYLLPGIAKIGRSSRSNQFRRILASCGLAKKRIQKKETEPKCTGLRKQSELSFHSLRHSATTMLKAAGVSDAIARAIIGHESAAISRTYTHLDLDTIREAMAKLPSL